MVITGLKKMQAFKKGKFKQNLQIFLPNMWSIQHPLPLAYDPIASLFGRLAPNATLAL